MNSGRGKEEELGVCGRTGEYGRDVTEIRSENVDRVVAELRHERQTEVKVDT